jgi:hypothetical protein
MPTMKRLWPALLITLALAACGGTPPNPNPRAAGPLRVARAIDLVGSHVEPQRVSQVGAEGFQ